MSASPRRKGTDMEKRHISAVQDGEKRVEYMRARRWGDWLLLLVVLCWGFVLGFIAFAEGVDRGTPIGLDSCRAGPTVLVAPAVPEVCSGQNHLSATTGVQETPSPK